jgi:hypothetical protein
VQQEAWEAAEHLLFGLMKIGFMPDALEAVLRFLPKV